MNIHQTGDEESPHQNQWHDTHHSRKMNTMGIAPAISPFSTSREPSTIPSFGARIIRAAQVQVSLALADAPHLATLDDATIKETPFVARFCVCWHSRRMRFQILVCAFFLLSLTPIASMHAEDLVTIPVDSPAFVFSPGNWVGNDGRTGKIFRQTWNVGAYFTVSWESKASNPTCKLLLDDSIYPAQPRIPEITYHLDGVWKSKIPCTNEIVIDPISGPGKHQLTVYFTWSDQKERWGSEGHSGLNILRVKGLSVDSESKPIASASSPKWALIIGDSITEGNGASELASYSFLIGQSLKTLGYEYDINACGWSGWLNRGDSSGDVPGFYKVSHSENGVGGQYDDANSRWNKIDGNHHSLLDASGHISAYGVSGQEPSLILINYGTNDSLHHSNPSDTKASIAQSLEALRQSAPSAQIVLLIPFGQYFAKEQQDAIASYKKKHPSDNKMAIIDLGPEAAAALASKNFFGNVHPNDRGHALFAARIIPQLIQLLGTKWSPDVSRADEPFPNLPTDWNGYPCYSFKMKDDSQQVNVLCPVNSSPTHPWVLTMELYPLTNGSVQNLGKTELELVKRGYYVVAYNLGNSFGAPEAIAKWDKVYTEMTDKYGLNKKVALMGLSRQGLSIVRWTSTHSDAVACLYLDKAVCDFKSWPGGKLQHAVEGKLIGQGSPENWKSLLSFYHFRSEAEALAWDKNPVDLAPALAAAHVPILYLAGGKDDIVPYADNGARIEKIYHDCGSKFQLILHPDEGHHPHGSSDPTPIVDFITANYK